MAFDKQYLTGNTRLLIIWLIVTIITIFALLTEVLQAYVFIGRNGSIYDFIADFAGVLVGLVVFNLYKRKKFDKLIKSIRRIY